MNIRITILVIFLFASFSIYAQSLKGYTIGENLGRNVIWKESWVAHEYGHLDVRINNRGVIILIRFYSKQYFNRERVQEFIKEVESHYNISFGEPKDETRTDSETRRGDIYMYRARYGNIEYSIEWYKLRIDLPYDDGWSHHSKNTGKIQFTIQNTELVIQNALGEDRDKF